MLSVSALPATPTPPGSSLPLTVIPPVNVDPVLEMMPVPPKLPEAPTTTVPVPVPDPLALVTSSVPALTVVPPEDVLPVLLNVSEPLPTWTRAILLLEPVGL